MTPLVLTLVLAAPSEAFDVRYGIDGGIAAAAFVAGALFGLVPVDTTSKWDSELLPFDEGVKQNISVRSAYIADTLLTVTMAAPLMVQLGGGVDEGLGQRALIYGETLGVTFALNSAAKYLVQRPRPYTYNPSPAVRAYAEQEGKDSRLSFYSGHAATAFAAAVAGSYLFAAESSQVRARAALWGVELALATATANFRVRAGKHFYTDVITGALAGAAVGWLVPMLHQRDTRYSPKPLEVYAMAGGLLLGALGSQLLPLSSAVSVPVDGAAPVQLLPLALERGAGMALAGSF